MSLPDSLRTFASALESAGTGLAAISLLTKTASDDKAADVLKLVGTGLDAILADLGIVVDAATVQAHLDAFTAREKADDAAIDKQIADKFDKAPA